MAWEPHSTSITSGPVSLASKRSKWNVARRLAGALAYLALSGGERVTITTFTHNLGENFGPTQGKQQMIASLRFLSSLEAAPPTSNGHYKTGLAHSLTRYARGHSEGGLLILISDLLDTVVSDLAPPTDTSGIDQLAEGLRHLTLPRWQVLVMHLLADQEMKPSFEGDFDFEDIETRENLPFYIDKDTLAQYRLRVRGWCSSLESVCTRQGTTYSRILAEWPLEKKVIPYLRKRGVVR
jgi:hypothetical protein